MMEMVHYKNEKRVSVNLSELLLLGQKNNTVRQHDLAFIKTQSQEMG